MNSPYLDRRLRPLNQAAYDKGKADHGRGVNDNPQTDDNIRAWWYRGWLDAQIASEETKHEQIRDQYARTKFGAQPQGMV